MPLRSALALAACLLLPAAAHAQAGTLRPGALRAASLRSGGQDAWTFEARAGQSLSATLTSDVFDTVLELWGPSGDMIESNDDGSDGTNSEIQGVRLPRNGRYRLVVRSYADGGRGAYAVRMALDESGGGYYPSPPYDSGEDGYGEDDYSEDDYGEAVPVAAGPVQIGRPASVVLRTGTAAEWTFRGRAGQSVSLTLERGRGRGDIDPYLELLSPSGYVLESDDDSGGEFASYIEAFRLPETGTYTVRGRDYSNSQAGRLTLTVSAATGGYDSGTGPGRDDGQRTGDWRDDRGPAPEDARNGQSGRLRAGQQQRFSVQGRRGEVVTIELESSDFDPEVSLRSPRGVEVARNDDGFGLNSRISRFRFTETGTYEVVVAGHDTSGAGRFTLRILR